MRGQPSRLGGSGAACTTPPAQAPSPPNGTTKTATNDGDPYSPIERYYQAHAAAEGWASYTLERSDSDYVRRFRRQSAGSVELREYVLHVQVRPDDPKAQGAMRLDERLIARAFEAAATEWRTLVLDVEGVPQRIE